MKLRIYDREENKFYYPSDTATCGSFLVLAGLNPNRYFIDEFTGAKDKNNKDIYVSDIIECKFRKNDDRWDEMNGRSKGIVKFDIDTFQYRVFYLTDTGKTDSLTLAKNYGHVVL